MSVSWVARWPTFPSDTLQRLGAAVALDDAVDAHVALPEAIVLGCSAVVIEQCFALCLQFWEDGFTRQKLLRLVHKLLRGEWLDDGERCEYKDIRARYKHLRFAQRLYATNHQADYAFDLTTRQLGRLQDAFRNRRRDATRQHARGLRMLLAPPVWTMVRWRMRHTCLDGAEAFLAYQQTQLRQLKKSMAQASFTGSQFHGIRKIVSQQVSFYDTLRSLDSSNQHAYEMSRFLAAINGLMGDRHDEMVAASISGSADYRVAAPLAEETRWRLEMLVARYPL